jgi:hypothetical protein
MPDPTYEVAIDFDDDGSFATSGDNVTADVIAGRGVVVTRGRDQIREIAPPRAARVDLSLDNSGAAYDVGTDLVSDLPLRIRASYGGTNYDLFRGRIRQTQLYPMVADQRVEVRALGPLAKLAGRSGRSTALYQNITTNIALGHILDAYDIASGDRAFDTGKTTLRWWWLDATVAPLDAMNRLLATEGPGAAIYEGKDSDVGKIVFKNRHARVTETRSTAVQSTIRGATTEPIMHAIRYLDGEGDVINSATMEQITRSLATLAVVWTLGETVTLAALETKKFEAHQTDRTPFSAAVLVADTDYVIASGALTTASLNRTSGSVVTVTLTAGGAGASVTGLQVRAQSSNVATLSDVTNVLVPTDATPKRALPTRVHPWAEIDRNDAQTLMDSYVSFFQIPRPKIEVDIIGNRHADALVAVLARDVGDRVRVISSKGAIDVQGHIEQVRHRIGNPQYAKQIVVTFGIEKATALVFPFALDTSKLGDDVLWF